MPRRPERDLKALNKARNVGAQLGAYAGHILMPRMGLIYRSVKKTFLPIFMDYTTNVSRNSLTPNCIIIKTRPTHTTLPHIYPKSKYYRYPTL